MSTRASTRLQRSEEPSSGRGGKKKGAVLILAPPELKARKWHKVMVTIPPGLQVPKWEPVENDKPTEALQKGKFKATGKRGKKRQSFNPEAPVTRRVRQRYSHALDATFQEGLGAPAPAPAPEPEPTPAPEPAPTPTPAAPPVAVAQTTSAPESTPPPVSSAPASVPIQPEIQISSKASLLYAVRNTAHDSLDDSVDPIYDEPATGVPEQENAQ